MAADIAQQLMSPTGAECRLWLQAADRRFVIYIGFRSRTGRIKFWSYRPASAPSPSPPLANLRVSSGGPMVTSEWP